ncbi:Lysosome membrane protein 2 (Lysosome membrane protein II) [Fasciola hepatica]|uniref:Scavenger receptor class B member 1 n=1 Tax=Fasciola hepatica TaxID=6192 RepID=A0A4E0R3D0_FASHE|nr:Lysosome membrane protein 2 (Lysosome membrane protein II) [Fasciola hepatica]
MKQSTFITFLFVCILFCILCAIGLGVLNVLFHYMVTRNIRLDNSRSIVYEQWLQPSVPIYLQFYFFNLTNPVEFFNGSKPHVTQQGPYTYREQRFKRDVNNNPVNGTIRYREVKLYSFDRSLSIGPESDYVTTVNLVYITLAKRLDRYPSIIVKLAEKFEKLYGENTYIRRNISDILWGYEDPLLRFLKSFIDVPSTRVGLYADRNNTHDGPEVEIMSGAHSPNQMGRILLYNNSKYLSCWTTSQANQINGTDGTLFHPFLKSDEGIYIFAPDICRSIYFTPRSVINVHGIAAVKYLPMEDTFDSPLENTKNRGFCIHWPYCTKTGVLDMSTCQPGAPIFISMPHLVNADKSYLGAIEGLHPSEEFNTTFYIEPITGSVLKAAKKLQINANVSQNSKFSSLSHVMDVVLPIMYVNESVVVDSDTAQMIRNSIYVLPLSLYVIFSVGLVLALTTLVVLSLIFLCRGRRSFNLSNAPYNADETTALLLSRDQEPL